MKHLELKLPPPVIALIVALLMRLAANFPPTISLSPELRSLLFALCTLLGSVIAIAGLIAFRQAKTTFNPHKPHTSTTLVTSGVYRVSRNPMYLGLLLCLLGWSLYLASIYALLLIALFVWYMNRFQIQPEERHMQQLFGDEFIAYKAQVRRWL